MFLFKYHFCFKMALKILNRILQNQDDRLLRSNLDPADLNKKGTGENIRQLSQSYSRAIASIFNAEIDEFC